jgi:Phage gp6-like head-tail connector protein
MVVAPNANALLTVDDLRGTAQEPGPLGITGTAQDDVIQELINRASDEIESYCGRFFTRAVVADLRLPQQSEPSLRPPRTPIDVTQPITISIDGTPLTVWRTEADGEPMTKQVIVGADLPGEATFFYRAGGWLCGCATPAPIRVSYTGGYATIPGYLKEAAQMTVQTFWRHRQNVTDLASMSSGTAGGVTTFRDYAIPIAAKWILDRHTFWVI